LATRTRPSSVFVPGKRIDLISVADFLRTLATPEAIANWSLTSLREKPIEIGARVVSHGRYVTFQMAEIAIPRTLFAELLNRISALRSPPLTAP
jgi:hypothetical protein